MTFCARNRNWSEGTLYEFVKTELKEIETFWQEAERSCLHKAHQRNCGAACSSSYSVVQAALYCSAMNDRIKCEMTDSVSHKLALCKNLSLMEERKSSRYLLEKYHGCQSKQKFDWHSSQTNIHFPRCKQTSCESTLDA